MDVSTTLETVKQNTARLQQSLPGSQDTNISEVERNTSLFGGSALTLFGIGLTMSRKQLSIPGIILALVGGALLYRGTSKHSYVYQALHINTAEQEKAAEQVDRVMTVNRPLKDFARFRQTTPQTKSTQEATNNTTIEREQRQAEDNAWSELQAIITAHSGHVSFDEAPNGRGTEVRAQCTYIPPAGKSGNAVLKLQGKTPKQEVSEALRHFKAVMESGEVVTTQGQPAGPH